MIYNYFYTGNVEWFVCASDVNKPIQGIFSYNEELTEDNFEYFEKQLLIKHVGSDYITNHEISISQLNLLSIGIKNE